MPKPFEFLFCSIPIQQSLYLFIFGYWVFTVCMGFSLVAESRGYCLVADYMGFLLQWLLLLQSFFRTCGLWQLLIPGSRVLAQWLWHTDFIISWHLGSSQIELMSLICGIKLMSPALAGRFFITSVISSPAGKPSNSEVEFDLEVQIPCISPQPFWPQGQVQWKTVFPWTEWDGMVWG